MKWQYYYFIHIIILFFFSSFRDEEIKTLSVPLHKKQKTKQNKTPRNIEIYETVPKSIEKKKRDWKG